MQKDYIDADFNGLPEMITSIVTANGKTTLLEHDVQNSTRTVTSPENRTAVTTYDPGTLLPLSSSRSG